MFHFDFHFYSAFCKTLLLFFSDQSINFFFSSLKLKDVYLPMFQGFSVHPFILHMVSFKRKRTSQKYGSFSGNLQTCKIRFIKDSQNASSSPIQGLNHRQQRDAEMKELERFRVHKKAAGFTSTLQNSAVICWLRYNFSSTIVNI